LDAQWKVKIYFDATGRSRLTLRVGMLIAFETI
jgi:hypothetical protein